VNLSYWSICAQIVPAKVKYYDFVSPKTIQKNLRWKNIYSIFRSSWIGVHGHHNGAARRILLFKRSDIVTVYFAVDYYASKALICNPFDLS